MPRFSLDMALLQILVHANSSGSGHSLNFPTLSHPLLTLHTLLQSSMFSQLVSKVRNLGQLVDISSLSPPHIQIYFRVLCWFHLIYIIWIHLLLPTSPFTTQAQGIIISRLQNKSLLAMVSMPPHSPTPHNLFFPRNPERSSQMGKVHSITSILPYNALALTYQPHIFSCYSLSCSLKSSHTGPLSIPRCMLLS